MSSKLTHSSLIVLVPFCAFAAATVMLDNHAASLGQKPTVVQLGSNTPEIIDEYSETGRQVELTETALLERARKNDRDAGTHYDLARFLEKEGRIPEAIESYRTVLELNPSHRRAALSLGSLLTSREQYEEAIRILTGAIEAAGGPSKARALLARGDALLRAGRAEDAVEDLRKAIDYRPDDERAWLHLGAALTHLANGQEEAERVLRNALSLSPKLVDAQVALGRLLLNQGREAEALEFYRSAVAADPYATATRYALAGVLEATGDASAARDHYRWLTRNENGEVQVLLSQGNIAAQDGDLIGAINLYRQATELDQSRIVEPQLKLAQTLILVERYDEALLVFRSLATHFPTDARGGIGVARVHLVRGEKEMALAMVGEVIDRNPAASDAWFLRGRLLTMSGRQSEAIEAYENALVLRPYERSTLLNLAVLKRKNGEIATAVALYRRILEDHPSYTPVLFNLALVLSRSGEENASILLYERILELMPSHRSASLNLAVLLRRTGNERNAERVLESALLHDPANVSLRYNLALLLDSTGRSQPAVEELTRITLLDDRFAKAWKSLGRIHESHGRIADACESYTRAIELDPQSSAATEGLYRCQFGAVETAVID